MLPRYLLFPLLMFLSLQAPVAGDSQVPVPESLSSPVSTTTPAVVMIPTASVPAGNEATPGPEPTSAPSAAAGPGKSIFEGKEDLTTLRAAMAAAQFEIRQNLWNRSELAMSLSRLVAMRCMPDLFSSLHHTKENLNQECLEVIHYTLSVDPSNPEAICAREGLDSPACIDSFRRQRTSTTVPFDRDGLFSRRFSEEIAIRNSELMEARESTSGSLYEATSSFQSDPSPANRAALSRLLAEMLDRDCAYFRIVPNPDYSAEQASQEKAISEASGPGTGTEAAGSSELPTFNEMLKKLANTPLVEETPIPSAISRIRLISMTCSSSLARATGLLPGFHRAVCHDAGFYSPACIAAIRKQRREDAAAQTPAGPAAAPSAGGMKMPPARGGLQPF